MAKFLTKEEKLKAFDELVQFYLNNDENLLGNFISSLFKELNVKQKWEIFYKNLPVNQQEILNALDKGWTIKRLDSVWYYEVDNKVTKGPFCLNRDPACVVVSINAINKLCEKGFVHIKNNIVVKV